MEVVCIVSPFCHPYVYIVFEEEAFLERANALATLANELKLDGEGLGGAILSPAP